jgi:hypothetical protein
VDNEILTLTRDVFLLPTLTVHYSVMLLRQHSHKYVSNCANAANKGQLYKTLSVTDTSKCQSLHVFLMILNLETFLPHGKSKYSISEQCSLSIALYTRMVNLWKSPTAVVDLFAVRTFKMYNKWFA